MIIASPCFAQSSEPPIGVTELIIESIERIEEGIKKFERQMDELTEEDPVVDILNSMPGTGRITVVTVRAYIDDIERFDSYKKLSDICVIKGRSEDNGR